MTSKYELSEMELELVTGGFRRVRNDNDKDDHRSKDGVIVEIYNAIKKLFTPPRRINPVKW